MSNPIVGSTVLIQITVTTPDGDLTAASVDLTIRDPEGNQTSVSPSNPSLGVYEYYLNLDEDGWWYAIWEVTVGSYVTVKECGVCAFATVLT